MSTEIPAGGGDQKTPVVKNNEGGSGRNNNRRERKPYSFAKREKFEGATPELSGFIFTAGTNRTSQIHNFTRTDERIKALVGQKYDPYVLQSLEEIREIMPIQPAATLEADGTMSKTNEIIFNREVNKWIDLKYTIEKERKNVYAIYYGQCDEEMKATLAMDPDYERINRTKDLIGLYKILQKVNYSYTASEEPIVTMWKAKLDWARIRQQPGQTVSEYYDRFVALKEVNENLQTDLYVDLGFPSVIARERGVDLNAMSEDDRANFSRNATLEGSERMEAIHFLHGANYEIFGDLIVDLKHSYLKNKRNEYPRNLQAAYTLLKGWTKGRPTRNPNRVGVSFNTLGDEEGEVMVNKGEKDPCKRCGRTNHHTKDCFAKRHEDGTVLHIETGGSGTDNVSTFDVFGTISDAHGLMFHTDSMTRHPSSISSRGEIPNTWILLDSQSTIDVLATETS